MDGNATAMARNEQVDSLTGAAGMKLTDVLAPVALDA